MDTVNACVRRDALPRVRYAWSKASVKEIAALDRSPPFLWETEKGPAGRYIAKRSQHMGETPMLQTADRNDVKWEGFGGMRGRDAQAACLAGLVLATRR